MHGFFQILCITLTQQTIYILCCERSSRSKLRAMREKSNKCVERRETRECEKLGKLAATLRWFTAGGAIRIALRQLSQTWKLRHYDVIDDVITRKL